MSIFTSGFRLLILTKYLKENVHTQFFLLLKIQQVQVWALDVIAETFYFNISETVWEFSVMLNCPFV